jgi:tetratricopeptide (TPR) repeat protein
VAITDYNKAISLNPNYTNAYISRGISKHSLKDYREAMLDFTEAIKINPNNADAYINRGISKIGLNQKDSGCIDLSKAGELGNGQAYDLIRKYCN